MTKETWLNCGEGDGWWVGWGIVGVRAWQWSWGIFIFSNLGIFHSLQNSSAAKKKGKRKQISQEIKLNIRRERNKMHAKATRERKKVSFLGL